MDQDIQPGTSTRRRLALWGVAFSVLLLIPGLFLPVLTVRGTLNPVGVTDLANQILEQGITESAMQQFRPLINPTLLPVLDSSQGGLRGAMISVIGNQLTAQLKDSAAIEVYAQTRSIVGSVRHLYSVGSNAAATLILVFSIMVPVIKSLLVSWAVVQTKPERRLRTLSFVEMIAKWSMADVFAVAVIIAYLAAQASQSVPGSPSAAIVVFQASFGAGFYWFAAYCLTSIAVQQVVYRSYRREGN